MAIACLVYLPLRRLKLKKEIIEGIKRVLVNWSITYHDDFMSSISKVQDAILEDLNLVFLKDLEGYPMLVVDPERRASNFIL